MQRDPGGQPLLTFTQAAADRLAELRSAGGQPLRISLRPRGCAGLSYDMARVEGPSPGDETVSHLGETVLLDPKAVLFLIGSVLDWKTGPMGSSFDFSNPNAVNKCGCGESFTPKESCRQV